MTTPELPTSVNILGTEIAVTNYEQTLDWIDDVVSSNARGYICVSAVHTVVACQDDPDLSSAVAGSSFTVPDGRPLVWALRLFGYRLPDRVYGPELMAQACARAAKSGKRFYLYGGRNEAALQPLQQRLLDRFPGLQIVGSYCPPFRPLSNEERETVIEDIDRCNADVVWVGIGVPKQEKWMAQMRDELQAPVLVGVGAAFDFHAGLIPQAPAWMQRHGLEWLFRLAQEPRRLWKRYLFLNPRFIVGVLKQWIRWRRNRLTAHL